MSRSDDPANWDETRAAQEQNAQRDARAAAPQGVNPHSQHLNVDPYSQPANQIPPGQPGDNYYQPNQPVPGQPATGHPVAQQPTHQQQYAQQQYAQQPVAQQPANGYPAPGQPAGQPAGQPVDPYGQAVPQTAYATQMDDLASQIEATQAAAHQPHQDQSQFAGYAVQPDPYTQPVQPVTQNVADDLQSYLSPQAGLDAPAADSLAFQPTGYAPASSSQPPEYDLGGIMAPDPMAVTQAPVSDHFRASTDLPSQHAEVDFGQNHSQHHPQTGDLGQMAEHFSDGPGGAMQSLEPGLKNDAEFYENQYAEDEFDDLEEGPARSGGFFKLVATLLMAVITGGGMAYGYKYYVASGGGKNTPAIIRADNQPAKMIPKNPGGKKFAHSRKAIFDRVGGTRKPEGAGYSLASGSADEAIPGISLSGSPAPNGGTKKVRTVSVRPDGSYAPNKPLRPSKPVNVAKLRQQTDSIAIPGITMAGSAPSQAAQPSRTRVATRVRSKNSAASVEKTLTDELVRKVSQPRPAPSKPVRVARVAPAQVAKPVTTTAAKRGSSPNGYVSQISSRKSRLDALSAFADLRQRYGSILNRSQPDIQEANLGSKGVWYRLRIGPPSSKQAAGELCSKLKSAGHKGCFVRAY